MVDKTYDGFEPDEKPELVIHGVGWAFFITSCWLAFMLFPGLFASDTFIMASASKYVTPEKGLFLDMAIIIVNHLAWMLGTFIISGYFFKKRRAGVYLSGVLLLIAFWRFQYIPLLFAGKVLLVTIWTLGTITVACYWNNLD